MRDYSTQATKHRRKGKKGPSAAVGVTLSIILTGAAVAALIWLDQSVSYSENAKDVSLSEVKEKSQPIAGSHATADEEKADETTALQHEIPEAPENFYTFYELLINGEVPISIEEGQSQDEAISRQLKSTLIQVASFRTHEAAEGTRVALLFLDLKARVIPPSSKNGGWYRIVLGPFKTKRDMSAVADVLAKNGFDAQVREE